MPSPSEYEIRIVDKHWNKTFPNLSNKEKEIINDKIMNEIRFNPYDSEPLVGELRGLFSYKIESGNRIVFAICHDCRKRGFTKVNNCDNCRSRGDNVVKLFVAGPHSVYDSLGRERRKRLRFKR